MPLPVIAASVLARLLLRGGIAAARAYAKKNGVRITAAVTKKAKNINKNKNVTKNLNKNKNKNKNTTNTTTTTKNTTKNTTTTGTTKPGTKSKVPAFIVAAGTIGGGAALMTSNKDKKSGSGMTFKEAFAKARKEKGKLATFTYKGKSYSTATADDVKKAGFKSLREYLNAKKK